MTDLEMTRLCAEAMGIEMDHTRYTYMPLHDDAQAMALARRFMLDVDFFSGSVQLGYEAPDQFHSWSDESLNRAIVECVAKMQAARSTGKEQR